MANQGNRSSVSWGTRLTIVRCCLGCLLTSACFIATANPPEIDYQPSSQTVLLYQDVAFGAIGRGTEPLRFQWRKDGHVIAGATNDQVVLRRVEFPDEGSYSVEVSNSEGSISSSNVQLTIN